MTKTPECDHCLDELWVCENHMDAPWCEQLEGGCECGAGAPCPVCNEGLQRGNGFDEVLCSSPEFAGDVKKWAQ